MADKQPVVCLVHGAMHQPLHFRYLIDALRQHGLIVAAPPLPTSGYDDASSTKTHRDDVARVREYLLPYIELGHRAVIVGHSYGGRIIHQAAEGLPVEERAKSGLVGGVVALLYITAFTSKDQPLTPEILATGPESLDPKTKLLKPEVAMETLYHDIEPERAREAISLLQRQSPRDLDGSEICRAWDIRVPRRYIACRYDRVIGTESQYRFVGEGGADLAMGLDCGHSPFLRDDGIEAIVKCIRECFDGGEV